MFFFFENPYKTNLEAGLIRIGYLVVATVGQSVTGQAEGHAKTTGRLAKQTRGGAFVLRPLCKIGKQTRLE